VAYFVRNASKIAFKANKNGVFIERFAKFCLSKNISHNIKFFLYQGMVYKFEMCNTVFTKTETPESRQIESQDCLKFATSLCDMSI
jgi:hypothetical protein